LTITVEREEYSLPFSRGILARSLIQAGVGSTRAYRLAEDIESDLKDDRREKINSSEVFDLTRRKLRELDPELSRKYRLWREIRYCKMPMFILIGGGTGVGTTSVAAELGYRLEIPRVVGTDAVREVMRKIISREFMPSLHESTYEAWSHLDKNLLEENKLVNGYVTQSRTVYGGVKALVDRSLKENISMIIEGVHLYPELFKEVFSRYENMFFYVLKLEDTTEHKNRFKIRVETSQRQTQKYLDNLDSIRRIHDFIVENARKNQVKIFENTSSKQTAKEIADDVLIQMVDVLNCRTQPP